MPGAAPRPAPAPARLVVAVDGPSGSGKSSACREVARRLGLPYLDTGAMYRAVCLAALDRGLDLADAAAVTALTVSVAIDVSLDPDAPGVRLDGRDVTARIRTSEVSTRVSEVARHPGVRAELVRRQRAVVRSDPRGCVVEGRDVTSVVAPDADVRVLLTADAAARVSRRALQLHGRETDDVRLLTVAEVVDRDAKDSEVTRFLEPAPGVVLLDTTRATLADTVAALLAEVARATARRDQPLHLDGLHVAEAVGAGAGAVERG